MSFKSGDKVLVNHAQLAVIQDYDVDADRVVYVTTPLGGGSDTTYAHISNTTIEPAPVVATAEPVVVEESNPNDETAPKAK